MRKRRTRKEKIIATLHRKLQQQSVLPGEHIDDQKLHDKIAISFSKTIIAPSLISHSISSTSYLTHDLKKSVFVTCAVICLEMLLFFILQKKLFGLSSLGL